MNSILDKLEEFLDWIDDYGSSIFIILLFIVLILGIIVLVLVIIRFLW